MKFYTVQVISIFLSIIFFSSCDIKPEKKILIKNWEMLDNQERSLEAVKRDTWKPIKTPSFIHLNAMLTKGIKYVWIRGEFNLSDPDQYYGISAGNIYFFNTMYINNTIIGNREPDDRINSIIPTQYKISHGLLKKGKNEIYVYMGIYNNQYWGVSDLDTILFLDKNDYIKSEYSNELLYNQFPLAIVLFLFSQILFNVILYIWNKDEKVHILFTMLCIINMISIITFLFPYHMPADIALLVKALYVLSSLFSLLYVYLLQSIYRIYFSTLNRNIIILSIIISIIITIDQFILFTPYLALIILIFTYIFYIFIILFIIYRAHRIKPDRIKFLTLLLFGGIFPPLIDVSGIILLLMSHTPSLISVFYFPIFIMALIMIILRDIITKQAKQKLLYKELTDTLKRNNSAPITSHIKDKLEQVIIFLQKSYTDDISREGLASAVDLSPDHLGKMFKSYTGKKINEYINDLRIREAARLLLESDNKIIDIAFHVGFESLVTFNRSFIRIMEKNPTEYRKEHKNLREKK